MGYTYFIVSIDGVDYNVLSLKNGNSTEYMPVTAGDSHDIELSANDGTGLVTAPVAGEPLNTQDLKRGTKYTIDNNSDSIIAVED